MIEKVKLTEGANVSRVSLGACYFGSTISPEASMPLLDAYLADGGNFIDTADCYVRWVEGFTGGESETLIGNWMEERKNRSQVFLATKCGLGVIGQQERGLRYYQIIKACENSLRRLKTDYIDLYFAHSDDRTTPVEETMEAFTRLTRDGKVRFAGASNYHAWRLAQARMASDLNRYVKYCCIQERLTYLRPRPGTNFKPNQVSADEGLMDYCETEKIPIIAYNTQLEGIYAGRTDRLYNKYTQYDWADTTARLQMLKTLSEETGATNNQLVLAWLMARKDQFIIPIFSCSKLEQYRESIGCFNVKLTGEQFERLDKAGA